MPSRVVDRGGLTHTQIQKLTRDLYADKHISSVSSCSVVGQDGIQPSVPSLLTLTLPPMFTSGCSRTNQQKNTLRHLFIIMNLSISTNCITKKNTHTHTHSGPELHSNSFRPPEPPKHAQHRTSTVIRHLPCPAPLPVCVCGRLTCGCVASIIASKRVAIFSIICSPTSCDRARYS